MQSADLLSVSHGLDLAIQHGFNQVKLQQSCKYWTPNIHSLIVLLHDIQTTYCFILMYDLFRLSSSSFAKARVGSSDKNAQLQGHNWALN